ncbi:uncharacterized protein BDV14DRAFT_177037 [Aspergillus stella-maris]|uniref:uncharacterized protein n=1 Tax=Aspergillus stella-maris TaxID=1810926 RepID=UPI003CCDFF2C
MRFVSCLTIAASMAALSPLAAAQGGSSTTGHDLQRRKLPRRRNYRSGRRHLHQGTGVGPSLLFLLTYILLLSSCSPRKTSSITYRAYT